MRVQILIPMVSDRGALNVDDEVEIPDVEALEWIRLGRAKRIPIEPEQAVVARPAEKAVRFGRRRSA